MGIYVNENENTFLLTNDEISYLFRIMENGQLEQLYYGKQINYTGHFQRFVERSYRSVSVGEFTGDLVTSLESIKQEYPSFGGGDFREAAFEVELENGSHVMEFKYAGYEIRAGKHKIPDLPATFVNDPGDASTLQIKMKDELTQTELLLNYTIFEKYPVIARAASIHNDGGQTLMLKRMMSASCDLPDCDYEFVHLSGAWGRERHLYRTPLRPGIQAVGSTRGSSSHIHNPFLLLARKTTTEHTGEAYSMSLVYSGNFLGQVEVDPYRISRIMMGIHPSKFNWVLPPGGAFHTPEAILVYSDQGFNKMSQAYHRLYNHHLIRGKYAGRERPIVINNWEGTYFDFNEEKILTMAEQASKLGVELFVLDDGWFGKRNTDTTSLGDWFVNEEKLPNGLGHLSEKINALGMKFGLWFEPEMTNGDSHIMREHPEWVVGTPHRQRKQGRHQYVLDFSQPEVVDYVFSLMDQILSSANIEYIKWDMNRCISEAYSCGLSAKAQGEFFHRYILGVYKLYDKLIQKYPDILFESCASGGGRFDPGMLYYAPQTWTSDDSDGIERLKIQYGTSYVYPISSMGSHVSSIPNHQVGRMTPLDTRANVAYFGTFGYELDPCVLEQQEIEQIRKQIAYCKKHRRLMATGDFYRLLSPFEGNETAWMVVDEKKEKAVVGWYQVLSEPNEAYKRVKLTGLEEASIYYIEELDSAYSGSELMYMGITLTPKINEVMDFNILDKRDFSSKLFTLVKIDR
ncbi:alpha-galactosidase [Paenibacillus ehimensis]|uniref:alpha-galactosidase n=1 Tax=Paenibacillus ehimensis TaxID=79264 RepID=UPI0004715918|nr:alpha-galactosidase [Paenibacillus ehimensis]